MDAAGRLEQTASIKKALLLLLKVLHAFSSSVAHSRLPLPYLLVPVDWFITMLASSAFCLICLLVQATHPYMLQHLNPFISAVL